MADKDSKKEVKAPLLVKKEGDNAPVGEEDQTVKIPKPLKKDGSKVVLNSATDSAIRPSDATTMAPAVEMRKTETGNVEVVDDAPPMVAKANGDTGGASKTPAPVATEATANKGRKTIKLKPLKKEVPEDDSVEETMSMDRGDLMKDMSGMGGGDDKNNLEDESTVKIQKPKPTKTAHPTPNIPGSKETIKLRPSTPTGLEAAIEEEDNENEETVSVSKKTIRLVPKKPGDDDATQKTPKLQPPNAAKPSAPTVKLQAPVDDVTQKTPRPSAPTIKLPDTPAPEASAAPAAAAPPPASAPDKTAVSSKKTLKLKSSAPPPPAPQAMVDGDEPVAPATAAKNTVSEFSDKGSEPGIVMTLVAVLALLTVSYYVWMVAGQWAEQHQGVKSANVPSLSGTVK